MRYINAIFLGCKACTKGFVLYYVNTYEIFVSKYVHFEEIVLPSLANHDQLHSNEWLYIEVDKIVNKS